MKVLTKALSTSCRSVLNDKEKIIRKCVEKYLPFWLDDCDLKYYCEIKICPHPYSETFYIEGVQVARFIT